MTGQSQPAPRRRVARGVAWALFALACAAAGTFHVRLQQERQEALHRWARASAAPEVEERRMRAILDAREGRACRSELEAMLNDGRPFASRIDEDGLQAAVFRDPLSGIEVRMLFAGERLLRYRIRIGSTPRPRFPPEPPAWRLVEGTRQYAAAFGLFAWLLVLLVLLFPFKRLFFGQVLVAVAIVCTLAWYLRPIDATPWALPTWLPAGGLGPSRQEWLRTLFGNMPWTVGLFLLLASGVVLGVVQARGRVPRSHCAQCGYDLTANISGVCPECGTATVNRRPPDEPLWWLLRVLFHASAAACLVLAAATILLWGRSRSHWDYADLGTRALDLKLISAAGFVELRFPRGGVPWGLQVGSTNIVTRGENVTTPARWKWGWADIAGRRWFAIRVPHWFAFLVLLVPPVLWTRWIRRRRRRAREQVPSAPAA